MQSGKFFTSSLFFLDSRHPQESTTETSDNTRCERRCAGCSQCRCAGCSQRRCAACSERRCAACSQRRCPACSHHECATYSQRRCAACFHSECATCSRTGCAARSQRRCAACSQLELVEKRNSKQADKQHGPPPENCPTTSTKLRLSIHPFRESPHPPCDFGIVSHELVSSQKQKKTRPSKKKRFPTLLGKLSTPLIKFSNPLHKINPFLCQTFAHPLTYFLFGGPRQKTSFSLDFLA